MLDTLRSPLFVKLIAAMFAAGSTMLLVMRLRTFLRLGRRASDRRTFSDLPDLIQGPQVTPDQSSSLDRHSHSTP